jgi:hypothetical protein
MEEDRPLHTVWKDARSTFVGSNTPLTLSSTCKTKEQDPIGDSKNIILDLDSSILRQKDNLRCIRKVIAEIANTKLRTKLSSEDIDLFYEDVAGRSLSKIDSKKEALGETLAKSIRRGQVTLKFQVSPTKLRLGGRRRRRHWH